MSVYTVKLLEQQAWYIVYVIPLTYTMCPILVYCDRYFKNECVSIYLISTEMISFYHA